jgi:hypothetical protein
MSNRVSAKGKIIEALKAAQAAGRTPSRVHIPHDLELEMCTLDDSEVGQELAEAIVRDGPRRAFLDIAKNRIVGLDIIWDAASLAVE